MEKWPRGDSFNLKPHYSSNGHHPRQVRPQGSSNYFLESGLVVESARTCRFGVGNAIFWKEHMPLHQIHPLDDETQTAKSGIWGAGVVGQEGARCQTEKGKEGWKLDVLLCETRVRVIIGDKLRAARKRHHPSATDATNNPDPEIIQPSLNTTLG